MRNRIERATRPLVCGRYVEKQFRSLLPAGTLSTVAAYFAILINNIAVGNLLGAEALSAFALVSPYVSFILFMETAVSFGASVMISIETGRGEAERANEYFGQGVLVAAAAGVLLCGMSAALREPVMSLMRVDAEMAETAAAYYSSLGLFALLAPMDCLLLAVVLVEGDKKRLCVAVVLRLAVHVVLAVVLGRAMGAAGIGLAYGLSVLVSMALLAGHFRSKANTLRFRLHFRWKDLGRCLRFGLNDAAEYLFVVLSTLAINRFLLARFGEASLAVFAVIFNLLSVVVMGFDGVGAAAEPLLAGYHGEGNPVGVRRTMHVGAACVAVESIIAVIAVNLAARWIPPVYGIISPELRETCTLAIRIFSISMLVSGFSMLWNSYFAYTEHILLAVTNTVLRSLALRVICTIGLGAAFGLNGVWAGFSLAEILTLFTMYGIARKMENRSGGRVVAPLLLDRTRLEAIGQMDFQVTTEGVMALCDRVEEACILRGRGRKIALRARLLTEEYGMSMVERNAPASAEGELTMLNLDGGVRLTFRDNGRVENALTQHGGQTTPDTRARGTILASTEGNRYQLCLGDNKTTFEVS